MSRRKASKQREYTMSPLFPEDSLASLTVSPGNAEAKKMTATSGRKCAALLRNYGPAGYLVKMLLISFTWGSTTCLLTWKPAVTKHGRLYFRLVPSAPRTGETGCSLWPTPTSSDAVRAQMKIEWLAKHRRDSRKRGHGCSGIFEVAADEFGQLPSPALSEWIMGFPPNWTALELSVTP